MAVNTESYSRYRSRMAVGMTIEVGAMTGLAVLAANWNYVAPTENANSVPEPASIVLLLAAGTMAAVSRRSRR